MISLIASNWRNELSAQVRQMTLRDLHVGGIAMAEDRILQKIGDVLWDVLMTATNEGTSPYVDPIWQQKIQEVTGGVILIDGKQYRLQVRQRDHHLLLVGEGDLSIHNGDRLQEVATQIKSWLVLKQAVLEEYRYQYLQVQQFFIDLMATMHGKRRTPVRVDEAFWVMILATIGEGITVDWVPWVLHRRFDGVVMALNLGVPWIEWAPIPKNSDREPCPECVSRKVMVEFHGTRVCSQLECLRTVTTRIIATMRR